MEHILTNILNNPNYFNYLSSFLSDEDRQKIINKANSINTRVLYKPSFHGLHHSEKVMLNAYLIGKYLNLNDIDFQILLDAALYHDIGRSSDMEDSIHGYSSALKIGQVVTNPIYQNKDNLAILQAICDGHSRDDKSCRQTFENYEITESEYERYEQLYMALKDADALDRTRFGKTSKAALQSTYLRHDYSKKLIDFAYYMNEAYKWQISETLYESLNKEYGQGEANLYCYHGIGFNIFQLQSILKHGLLSEYAMMRQGLSRLRNFNGNNSDMWISVVPYGKKGKAYDQFVKQGISFVGLVPKWHEGIASKSQAKSTGLPHATDLYDDEVFVFDQIPQERICALVLPKQCINLPLNTLYYLNGSLNYDIVFNKIQYYKQHLQSICGYSPDTTSVSKILFEMQEAVLNFENASTYEQQQTYQQYFQKMDMFGNQINQQLQEWMVRGFQTKYKTNNLVTLGDVLKDFLHDMSYQMSENDNQILFQFPILEKEKSS